MEVNILKYVLGNNTYYTKCKSTMTKICNVGTINIFSKKERTLCFRIHKKKGHLKTEIITLHLPSLLRYPLTTCLKVDSCSSSLKTSCAWSTNPICFANSHRHLPPAQKIWAQLHIITGSHATYKQDQKTLFKLA